MPTGHKSNRQATVQRRRRSRRHRRNNWIILPKATSESSSPPQDLSDHETAPPWPSTNATDELADILETSLIIASWDAANEEALTLMPPPTTTTPNRSHHEMSALLLPDLTPCDENDNGMIVAPDASLEMSIAEKKLDRQEPVLMEVSGIDALTPCDE